MSVSDLNSLTVAELKAQLGNRGLPQSGRKKDLVTRLGSAGTSGGFVEKPGDDKEDSAGKSAQKECMATEKMNYAAGGEAGPSVEPMRKKRKIDAGGKVKGASKASVSLPRPACLDSCRPGKKHGCTNRSYGKSRQGSGKSCHEVERLLTLLGVSPKSASSCIKAAIMWGHIDIKGEQEELDMVVHEEEGDCGHRIQARLGDLMRQPDYAGLDYEDGCENATVVCNECDYGRTYVTELCKGEGSFNDGKQHNHCTGCPGFGSCIGDYRERHSHGAYGRKPV